MRFFKPTWCGRNSQIRTLRSSGNNHILNIEGIYYFFAVPSTDECALTTYFAFNGKHWVSFTDDWDTFVDATCDDERGQLVEIGRLEVAIGAGSVPKICGDDRMPVVRSYDP